MQFITHPHPSPLITLITTHHHLSHTSSPNTLTTLITYPHPLSTHTIRHLHITYINIHHHPTSAITNYHTLTASSHILLHYPPQGPHLPIPNHLPSPPITNNHGHPTISYRYHLATRHWPSPPIRRAKRGIHELKKKRNFFFYYFS